MQTDRNYCYRCKTWVNNPDRHHVFNGAYRHKSEEDGYVVYVHRQCHELIHRNAEIRLKMKAEAQRDYEKTHSREEFIERYGRSYL